MTARFCDEVPRTVDEVSYRLRDEFPGYHHVSTRGNNKRVTFKRDRDRVVFCSMVDRLASKFEWRILAYALMKNHYHLLVRVGEKGLAQGMCELNGGYAAWFNAEHNRVNHLFGRRYFSSRSLTDASVRERARYIVQNPRRAGGTRPLEAYRWTSYAATVGLRFPTITLARDELLEFFGATPELGTKAYRAFCLEEPWREQTRPAAAAVY